jgi:hypothetical protein
MLNPLGMLSFALSPILGCHSSSEMIHVCMNHLSLSQNLGRRILSICRSLHFAQLYLVLVVPPPFCSLGSLASPLCRLAWEPLCALARLFLSLLAARAVSFSLPPFPFFWF